MRLISHAHRRRALVPWLAAIAVAAIPALFAASPAFAEEGLFSVGAHIGPMFPILYHPDVDEVGVEPAIGYGLHAGYGISARATAAIEYVHGDTSADVDQDDGTESVDVGLDLLLAEIAWEPSDATIRPVFLGGVDWLAIRADKPLEGESDFGFHFGMGFDVQAARSVVAGLRARYHLFLPQDYDSAHLVSLLAQVRYLF
ncbi:outer membrane beta-barrel protein [bacterium]|nr:outer membrane beta-barrel protein [bacterium]MCB9477063.1 outer membrane beta-barrel protein [Deltaproteobacteria bacterium]